MWLLLIVTSGASGLRDAVGGSLLLLGADSFSADLVAVVARAPGALTMAVSDRVAEPPLAIAPMFQSPVPLVYVPCDGTTETKGRPAAVHPVTWNALAFEGQRLLAVIVKVTFEPMMTVPLLA